MSGPAAKSKQLANEIQAKGEKYSQGSNLRPESGFTGYPVKYFEKDPRDDYYETKKYVTQNVGKGNAVINNLGNVVPVTQEDIQYLQDQRTKEEKILFDSWKYKTFSPGSDPVRQKYYEKIDPSFYKEREAEIDRVFELIKKLALLSLHSVRKPEDLVLLYGLKSGRIPFPDWRIYMPFEKFDDVSKDIGPESVIQGYWNPRKFVYQQKPGTPDVYSSHPLWFGSTTGEIDANSMSGEGFKTTGEFYDKLKSQVVFG